MAITNVDYADDIEHLANTPTLAEFLLHNMEQVARDTRLHVSTDKTEYMCFNQEGNISSLNSGSLKLVDKFLFLGSSVSPTERDIICVLKKRGRLSIGYQSYGSLINPIK